MTDIERRPVMYVSDGFPMRGYFCAPKDDSPHPAVIVLHEIYGLNEHIKSVADRLAQEGYAALAVDLYSRRGGVPSVASREELLNLWQDIDDMLMIKDLSHSLLYLRGEKNVRGDKIGVLGFCMGGTYALLMGAFNVFLKASVSFYGGITYAQKTPQKSTPPLEAMSYLNCPVLYVYGGDDSFIPGEDVEKLEKALKQKNKKGEIITYPGCGHGFFNETRESYNEEAARGAWEKTLAFLKEQLQT